jgi:LmbE family N-acetylglucosaminyl deacetylase
MNRVFENAAFARVLAFGAHPDDVEVGAGGLLARLRSCGAQVVVAVTSCPTEVNTRMLEATEGARVLGAKLIMVHGDRQGRVEDVPMHELVGRYDKIVAEVNPDLVLTHSSSDLHWDHGLVNRATISALRRAPCDLLAFTSSYELNAHSRVLGTCFADITKSVEVKLEAIRKHKTQLPKLSLDSTLDLARAMGRICGVEYAEAFEVLRMRI